MRKRYLFLVVAFTFGLVLHLVEQYTTGVASNFPEATEEEVEYYGERLVHRQYGEDGLLQQTLTAQQSEYFGEQGLTRFVSPAIVGQNQSGNWQINAAQGEISDHSSQLALTGGVQIQSIAREPDFLIVETSEVMYQPENGEASSDKAVTLRSRWGTTTADGFTMDTSSQRLTLKSNVRTLYEQD
ncbi:MAG: LPS export ABC transporter periplasmic protein LptC [Oceanospirillaceae bacterium]|nr:LPS export ABC transporter periplasmic protein LptC [Oceanospirillaceae bacterium]|tara:strand:+ start:994 stop:1548 length:555 start_codon:yes stop_codon:yes gene_type:complete